MLAGSCIQGTICKDENGTSKVGREAFNTGVVWIDSKKYEMDTFCARHLHFMNQIPKVKEIKTTPKVKQIIREVKK